MAFPSLPTFTALEWLELPRTMREYKDVTFTFPPDTRQVIVCLDRETTHFQHLLGQRICIDDKVYICFLVDRFLHAPPWHPGERIGLIVAPNV